MLSMFSIVSTIVKLSIVLSPHLVPDKKARICIVIWSWKIVKIFQKFYVACLEIARISVDLLLYDNIRLYR